MKIAIFGLGNFGFSLAVHLADTGNEVIVADNDPRKIDLIKEKVAHAVVMDTTNENAYQALPLKDLEFAVIAIGVDEGAAIMTTAIIKKNLKCKIIARSSSRVQDTIFQAMGIDQIVHPEQEFAERMTKKFNLRGSIDNFELLGDYLISEVEVCQSIIGETLIEAQFREEYNLNIITIMRQIERTNILGRRSTSQEVIGLPKPDTVFQENDILVVFGKSKEIDNYLKRNNIDSIK